MRRALVVSVVMLAALALAACGGSGGTTGGMMVSDAWARSSPMLERAGAAYLVIQNNGAAEDRLLSVESDVARTIELHETKEMNGMMQMSPVPNILVPAGGKAELKPGGFHVMLIGLNRELKAGDKIQLTLNFEKAGKIPVTAEVREQ
jgi:periplasmic copper chaperone A